MDEPFDRRMLQQLESAESILEVGCGDGRLTRLLAYHTRKKVTGLDISSRGFSTAYESAEREGVGALVE